MHNNRIPARIVRYRHLNAGLRFIRQFENNRERVVVRSGNKGYRSIFRLQSAIVNVINVKTEKSGSAVFIEPNSPKLKTLCHGIYTGHSTAVPCVEITRYYDGALMCSQDIFQTITLPLKGRTTHSKIDTMNVCYQ